MKATRWIVGMSLALGMEVIGPAVRASVDLGGDSISGVDGRDAQMTVEPERLAAWRLERLGARMKYDETKINQPVIAVDLSGCRVTGAVVKELQSLQNLRYLDLKGRELDDMELKLLASSDRLNNLRERSKGYIPPPAVVP